MACWELNWIDYVNEISMYACFHTNDPGVKISSSMCGCGINLLHFSKRNVIVVVLPKFDVNIDAPSYFYYKDSVLTINIRAK